MTRFAAISVLVLMAFGCQKKAATDFSHSVPLNRTATTNTGDSITIIEVRGPFSTWVEGATYEVRGRYKLVSRDKAQLAAYVTTMDRKPESSVREQWTEVSKGEGEFTLRFPLVRGWADCPIGSTCGPHVSFYPSDGGEGFLAVYI
jgi:hypothetical protein